MATTPRTLAFRPIADRKFYLSEAQKRRLGGEQPAEIMRLMVEEALSDDAIKEKLGLTTAQLEAITLTHYFKRCLNEQIKLREKDAAYKESQNPTPAKAVEKFPTNPKMARGKAWVPAPLVNLPKGVSAPEYAQKRINEATPEAVEKLIWMMRYGHNEQVQYNSAVKLLGLNGIVEVEKSINIIADAEAIIRELNKRGPYRPKADVTEAEVVEVTTDQEGESGQVDGPGESGPLSPPSS